MASPMSKSLSSLSAASPLTAATPTPTPTPTPLKPYPFQEETARTLATNPKKHLAILPTGTGKTLVSILWTSICRFRKVLVVTTASKVRSGDWEADFQTNYQLPLPELEVISWHKFYKWTMTHRHNLSDYAYIFDEVARAKGYSTQMGTAFLRAAKQTDNWIGLTATPGENWLHFLSYFVATGYTPNKTRYLRDHAIVQTYKGYPEITKWTDPDTLNTWWHEIAHTPDTSIVTSQLPAENHHTVTFPAPHHYAKVRKSRTTPPPDSEFCETSMALCHALRRLCSDTAARREWLTDFLSSADSPVILFYNYQVECDALVSLAEKATKQYNGKVWVINGKEKNIPTKDTIGAHDTVICQWQAASEGLNLQFIHLWVATSPNYSYSTFTQAKGRVKRIGQEHPIHYYYLTTKGTIEQDIYKCLGKKQDFDDSLYAPLEDDPLLEQ